MPVSQHGNLPTLSQEELSSRLAAMHRSIDSVMYGYPPIRTSSNGGMNTTQPTPRMGWSIHYGNNNSVEVKPVPFGYITKEECVKKAIEFNNQRTQDAYAAINRKMDAIKNYKDRIKALNQLASQLASASKEQKDKK